MRSFIVDLTLRICRERTVDYFLEDFPAGGPDGMASPGEEGKVVAILRSELAKRSITATTHAKVAGRENLLARVGKGEVGIGVGIEYLLEQRLIDCTDAIIPDIAGDMRQINIAEKGRVLLKVKAHGKQAHAMKI